MSKPIIIEHEFNLDNSDIAFRSQANYTPAVAGVMYHSNGDPGDPPEGEEIEFFDLDLLSIKSHYGEETVVRETSKGPSSYQDFMKAFGRGLVIQAEETLVIESWLQDLCNDTEGFLYEALSEKVRDTYNQE